MLRPGFLAELYLNYYLRRDFSIRIVRYLDIWKRIGLKASMEIRSSMRTVKDVIEAHLEALFTSDIRRRSDYCHFKEAFRLRSDPVLYAMKG